MFTSLARQLDDLLVRLESHPCRVLTCVGLLFALLYVSSHTFFPRDHGRIINGDAIQYYAHLRSLAVDGDLDFRNDYRLINNPLESEAATQSGAGEYRSNLMSIGPALLWAPFFLLAGASLGALQLAGAEVRLDGVSAPFTLSVGVAGVAYATAGFYLCYDICRRFFSSTIAFWATLTVWLGTSAVSYSLVSPAYSHAVSLFGVALVCHTWVRTRGRESLGRYVLLGGLGGLAALIRWQDIIVLLLPIVELLDEVRKRRRPVNRASRTGRCTRRRRSRDAHPAVARVARHLWPASHHATRGGVHALDCPSRTLSAVFLEPWTLHMDAACSRFGARVSAFDPTRRGAWMVVGRDRRCGALRQCLRP